MTFLKCGLVPALILFAVEAAWPGGAAADTIIDVPSVTGYYGFPGAALAESWSQTFSVVNGSISVPVAGPSSGGPIGFYLTTNIGPTATLNDLVRFVSIDLPDVFTNVTPFSNLNLEPGTYYLVVADETPNDSITNPPEWTYWAGSDFQAAPGLTLNPLMSADPVTMYPPAAPFQSSFPPYSFYGDMSFTGTIIQAAPTPEPPATLTLSFALITVGALRATKHRRIRPQLANCR